VKSVGLALGFALDSPGESFIDYVTVQERNDWMLIKTCLQLVLLAFAFSSPRVSARELNGVEVSENLEVEGTKFQLHGAGLRSKLMIKVYVGGLYLVDNKTPSAEILDSTAPKAIKLHFKRNVGSDTIRTAWKEGFANNCAKNCEAFAKDLEKLSAATSDMQEKDTMTFYLSPEKVSIYRNEEKKVDIASKGFWVYKIYPSCEAQFRVAVT
jgi:Chalcone isomerase-like